MKPNPFWHHVLRWPLYLALPLLLMGQDCDPQEVPPNGYCSGAVVQPESTGLTAAYEYVSGGLNAIIYGEPASERHGTVQVLFGQSYCSGTIIGPHTVLTAAHCGYAATTTHKIRVDGVIIDSTEHLYHPDYNKWINGAEDRFEGRKADLMLVYTEAPLPTPYITKVYSSTLSNLCRNIYAQGWGRTEEDPIPCPNGASSCLREADYSITNENEKTIQVVGGKPGRICFGDSGGPLYADTGGEQPMVAGVASTTMSQDCLVGSTHVKVSAFNRWISENKR